MALDALVARLASDGEDLIDVDRISLTVLLVSLRRVSSWEDYVDVLLRGPEDFGLSAYRAKVLARVNVSDASARIQDVLVAEPNAGWGSLVVAEFLRCAAMAGVRNVDGVLSPHDYSEHGDRLVHF